MTVICPKRFSLPFRDCLVAVVDYETTGVDIGKDAPVEIAIALFTGGKYVDGITSLINPGIHIPAEATAIHGYTDDDVECAPSIEDFWQDLPHKYLDDVQFCSYSGFDKHFVPKSARIDHTWPWLDILEVIRAVDPYVRGKGRHKLEASCKRHGIPLDDAHKALPDAKASGQLLYTLYDKLEANGCVFETLGDFLEWTQIQKAKSWGNFFRWLSKQPPLEQP